MQRRFRHKRQQRAQRLGMDELMIVNPARNGIEAVFLDDDGVLREVRPVRSGARQGPEQRPFLLAGHSAGPCLHCGAARRRRIRNY